MWNKNNQYVDMFPCTIHVETVVLIEANKIRISVTSEILMLYKSSFYVPSDEFWGIFLFKGVAHIRENKHLCEYIRNYASFHSIFWENSQSIVGI